MELISVVIPALNAARFIGDAIESVLAQDWPDLEIIIVDNGSTDGTYEIARDFGGPVRCHRFSRRGQPRAMNHGIGLTRGSWLSFLDADDLWAPRKIAIQRAAFDASPQTDAVFAHAANFSGEPPSSQDVPGAPAPLHGTLLIRREAFFRVGYLDEQFTIGSIMDWYMRAQEAGIRMTTLPQTLLFRRLHDDNLGTRERDQRKDYARILKAALDRRRR
ncbi:MAG: glycosyltransferase [Burkholderiaceae bacterium]|nr:glycosyltransferase [Burkholderiaceae bacterium]